MTLAGSILTSLVVAAGIESVPFVFRDAQAAYAAADGPLGAYVRDQISAAGIFPFPKPFEIGFYQITNNVRPITTAADFAGIKMRTSNSKLAVDTFKSLGSSIVPMNFNEVYTALQTHVADGQYNPYSTIESAKLFEVQKYLSELNLAWGNFWLLGNQTFWSSLSPEIQAIVTRNANTYVDLQRRDTELFSAASADKLVRQGMIRNVAPAASFRAKLIDAGFYQRWRDEFGPKEWALLEAISGKLG
jgi:TRAP-type C4-dicarboxylate transport system substrate-binding protein